MGSCPPLPIVRLCRTIGRGFAGFAELSYSAKEQQTLGVSATGFSRSQIAKTRKPTTKPITSGWKWC